MQGERVFHDKVIRCVDCQQSFRFSCGEQKYFFERGLKEPRRCPACRELRKRTVSRQEVADG